MDYNNADKVSFSDVVAIAKSVAPQAEIPSTINVDTVASPNSTVTMDFVESGDDRGVNIKGGELSVGSRTQGYETVLGQGDSYPVEIAYTYNTANEVGSTIAGATDVTAILQSDSGSSVPYFENNLDGDVLLIGADQPFFGVKVKYDSVGSLEPDRVIAEYFNASDNWIGQTFMVTESGYPYRRANWNLASYLSEQVRFGDSILTPNTEWQLNTLTINGTPITKYWARLRLITPITTVPVVQQIKQHTSRTEINADGAVEFFGLARGLKNIDVVEVANADSDPANENVTYFTGGVNGGTAKLIDNQLNNNAIDSRLYLLKIDQDIDTSTPALLSIPFYVDGTATGDINFIAEIVQITQSFVYDTLVNPDETLNQLYTISTNSNLQRQILQFEIPLNKIDVTAGGVIVVITRDAIDDSDTLNNNIVFAGSIADGKRWRL